MCFTEIKAPQEGLNNWRLRAAFSIFKLNSKNSSFGAIVTPLSFSHYHHHHLSH